MRMLKRNKRSLYYANPTGEVEQVKDEWGNLTGEEMETFTDPVKIDLNISGAYGQEAIEVFGSFTSYSHTIAADLTCPIVERARVWYGADPTGPHNFEVRRKAESLNSKLYALSEV